ncbi:histidine kinase dimerization/phosphoacceptor domain -containing protein [Flavobacterium sp. XS2P14]|uniref:tetratricopeptide repeat-containing sensor histidine kinase n=1 Tax=Flavobacterium sp. XS2P14 TaxID=3401735 RepID=UPI003AAE1C09
MNFKFFILIFIINTTFCFSQSEFQKSVDSLYVLIDEESNDKEKIKHYLALCSIYRNSNSTALNACNEKLLTILKKTNSTGALGHYYLNKSVVYFNQDKYKQSLSLALKSQVLSKKNRDTLTYLSAVITASDCYVQLIENEKTKNILKDNLKLALTQENTVVSIFYTKIAQCYIYQDSIQSGLRYYKKTVPYLSQKKSQANALFYERLSMVYRKLRQKEKALYYIDLAVKNAPPEVLFLMEAKKAYMLNATSHYKEALKLSLKNYKTILSKNKTHLWQYNLILYNISNSYFHLKQYDAAQYYIKKVIDKKNTIIEKKIDCYILLSKIHLDLNDKGLAQSYINKALIFRDSLYPTYPNIVLYDEVAKIEERLGNFEKALFYHKKKTELEIDNLTKLNNEKVFELQTDFDVALKDKNIAVLVQEKKNSLKEKIKQSENLLFVSVALLFAFLFLLFYVKNYKAVKTKNLLIESEKIQVKKSLLEKETLLKEIHHRVKNNLQLVMSLLNIQAQKDNQDVEGFLAVSKSRILSMALIHENLYQSENLNAVNFKEYICNLTQIILNAYQTERTPISLQIKMEDVYFDIQTAIPLGLIINELVNNAYKHAFVTKSSGCIIIQLIPKGDHYELSISDNGVGITQKNNAKKTLGLQLVEELVFQIDGKLLVENNNGMQYSIEFQTTKTV